MFHLPLKHYLLQSRWKFEESAQNNQIIDSAIIWFLLVNLIYTCYQFGLQSYIIVFGYFIQEIVGHRLAENTKNLS